MKKQLLILTLLFHTIGFAQDCDTPPPLILDDAPYFCNAATLADIDIEGEMIQWYDTEIEGTPLPDNFQLESATYYASQTVDGCESEDRTIVNVNFIYTDSPSGPAVQGFCYTGSVGDLLSDNVAIWYDADEGGNMLSLNTPLVNLQTYYGATVTDGCESIDRLAVQAILYTTQVDVLDSVTTCSGYELPELEYGSYFLDMGGEGTMLSAGTLITETTTIYIYNEDGTDPVCSNESSFTVTIGDVDAPLGDAEQSFCNEATIADFVTNIETVWYDASENGNVLPSDTPLVNLTTYYGAAIANNCESASRLPVQAILLIPEVDIMEDVTACSGYELPELQNGNYFSEAGGLGNTLSSGTEITETTTIFIYNETGTEPVCSNESSFTITIEGIDPPVGNTNQSITSETTGDATIEDIIAEGEGIITWHLSEEEALAGESALPGGTVLTDGVTYYAIQTVDGCISASALAVTINIVLGNEAFDLQSFNYYPNPVSNVLNLSYSGVINTIEVYNVLGQKIIVKTINENEGELDISALSPGPYLLKVMAGNTKTTLKVIKQ